MRYIARISGSEGDEILDDFEFREDAINALKEYKVNADVDNDVDYYIDLDDNGKLVDEQFIDISELEPTYGKSIIEDIGEWGYGTDFVCKKEAINISVGAKAYYDSKTGMVTGRNTGVEIGHFLKDNNDGTAHIQISNIYSQPFIINPSRYTFNIDMKADDKGLKDRLKELTVFMDKYKYQMINKPSDSYFKLKSYIWGG